VHPDALNYVNEWLHTWKIPFGTVAVLEIGSRDVNGSVRQLLAPDPDIIYVGIDTLPGKGVDLIADGATYDTQARFDLILCCEVLEHAANFVDIIKNAYRLLTPNGYFVFTCAGPTRNVHSAIDAGELRPGEYYFNLRICDLGNALVLAGFREWDMKYNPYDKYFPLGREFQDIYGWAQRQN
jgi:SAM-dependent methyltransferase